MQFRNSSSAIFNRRADFSKQKSTWERQQWQSRVPCTVPPLCCRGTEPVINTAH